MGAGAAVRPAIPPSPARPSKRKAANAAASTPTGSRSPKAKGSRKGTNAKAPAGPAVRPFTVFLDRDGVFNANPRLAVFRARGFKWLPGAKEAFAQLNRPGIRTCLATNQPLLGLLTFGRLAVRVNRALQRELEAAGGRLDRIEAAYAPPGALLAARVAPRRLRSWVRRRKPWPGMLESGGAALAADRGRAVMVGDKVKDGVAAAAYGIPCILLATTHTADHLRRQAARRGLQPLAILAGLPEAVPAILRLAEDA